MRMERKGRKGRTIIESGISVANAPRWIKMLRKHRFFSETAAA
jgi:hypothetical protein